jgi:hypothetical protein
MRVMAPSLPFAKEIFADAKNYGDLKLEWDKLNKKSVEVARAAFDKAISRGLRAFRVDPKGNKEGEALRAFDVDAEEILLIAPIAGG